MEKLNLLKLIDFIFEETKNYDNAECIRRRGGERKDVTLEETYEKVYKAFITDVLDYLSIQDGDDLELYKDKDFFNDQNKDGKYFNDLANERTDSQVNIYNREFRESAPIFQEEIEEWIESVGVDGCGIKEGGLIKLFQGGQYNFYNRITNEILGSFEKYFEGLDK